MATQPTKKEKVEKEKKKKKENASTRVSARGPKNNNKLKGEPIGSIKYEKDFYVCSFLSFFWLFCLFRKKEEVANVNEKHADFIALK